MASTQIQAATCPECKQSDQVKTLQTAYISGVARCAPPDMPMRNISMMKYIIFGGVTVGICVFLVIILIGSEAKLGNIVQWIIVCLTFISVLVALVISYIAFDRVVRGDNEAAEDFPAWDDAMKTWNSLSYCARNDIVFDPATDAVISDEQLALLRTLNKKQAAAEVATLSH